MFFYVQFLLLINKVFVNVKFDPSTSLVFQGHKKWITGISWEPVHLQAPCRRFVSSSKDGDARIWDISLRKCVICLAGHTLAVTCVKWGGDGMIYTRYTCFYMVYKV